MESSQTFPPKSQASIRPPRVVRLEIACGNASFRKPTLLVVTRAVSNRHRKLVYSSNHHEHPGDKLEGGTRHRAAASCRTHDYQRGNRRSRMAPPQSLASGREQADPRFGRCRSDRRRRCTTPCPLFLQGAGIWRRTAICGARPDVVRPFRATTLDTLLSFDPTVAAA